METERTPVERDVWLGWVAASAVGLTIGLLVYLPLALILGDELDTIARTLVSGGAGAALGASIGIAQWLLLRRRGASEWGRWVLASVAGGAVGGSGALLVADISSSALRADFLTNLVLGGAFLGASLGVAQSLLLRRRFARAGWWVAASGVGLSLGLGVGRIGGAALYNGVVGAMGPTPARLLATAIFGALIVVGYGAITGVVLVRLQRQRSDASLPPASQMRS